MRSHELDTTLLSAGLSFRMFVSANCKYAQRGLKTKLLVAQHCICSRKQRSGKLHAMKKSIEGPAPVWSLQDLPVWVAAGRQFGGRRANQWESGVAKQLGKCSQHASRAHGPHHSPPSPWPHFIKLFSRSCEMQRHLLSCMHLCSALVPPGAPPQRCAARSACRCQFFIQQ